MQRLRIHHITEYHFPAPVTLNQHRLLLRPREGHDVRIESSRLEISPAFSIQWYRDVFDNSLAAVRFHHPSSILRVASQVVIQHYEDEPLRFNIEEYAQHYPFSYQQSEQTDLSTWQQPLYWNDQPVVRDWLGTLGLLDITMDTFELQTRINLAIHRQLRYLAREEQGVQSPAHTLRVGSGSCRDFATLFMETCHCLGLASRFVSGYLHAPATEAGHASTHAWAEVYLPGSGWRGFDPTIGEATRHRHIAVAVARDPQSVPPVAGSFIGPGQIRPRMLVNVQVNALD